MASILDDIDQEGPSGERLPDLELGQYKLRVLNIAEVTTFRQRMQMLKCAAEVLTSQKSVEGVEPTPPGTIVSIRFLKDSYGYYKKEIAAFISALINEPTANVKPEMAKELVAQDQPATGNTFLDRVVMSAPNAAGKQYKRHIFSADVPEKVKQAA